MKARHLRTLEAFLKEYSGAASGQQPVKPGNQPSGPVGSGNQAHDNADVNKAERDRKAAGLPKDAVNTELQSKADAGELDNNQGGGVSPGSTTASKVAGAPDVRPPGGAGTQVSKVATSGSPTTGKGTKEPVAETDKLKKFKPRGAFGRSAVKSTLKKKLPTGRLLKEADQPEFVVEINFNSKEVVSKALNGPVNCGFEAELIFPRIQNFDAYDDDYGEDDSMIERIANSEYESEIRELYRKTLLDYDNAYGEAFFEFQMEQMNRDFEDEDWLNDFVMDTIDDDDVEDYKKETLDGLDKDSDEYEDRADWSEDAWGRELAELKYKDEMQDYWMDLMDDYQLERLVNRFEDNNRYGIDNWMMDSGEAGNEYWTDANEYLQMGDSESDRSGSSKYQAYEEVEKWLFDWAKMNSHNADIEVGGYHETESHDGWRIEEDGSLDGDGPGFEVISPVFETPKEMLKEMKSLFEYAQGSTETNRTTGLHVTMSYAEPSDVPTNIAKTKMYVLSGADNQAKVWGREFNSYSQSTKVQVLQALRAIATGNASEDNIKTMDDMITQFDASGEANKVGRQSTVNVKSRRNSEGNSLVEFRAAGGPGYIDDFGQVAKDVTRYSATIQASYDEDAYNKEFAKKMYKWLQDAADVEDPQAYSSTKGLSPQDVYRQSTGDTSFDVDNHPLTDYMMRFTHSTFHDNVKQTLTRFFSSLKNMQDYAQQHNLQLNEYEENPEEVLADFKFSTAEAFTDLLGYLALSPNTDKMNTKELMAIRKLIRKYGVNQEEILKALKRDTGNPRLIPDPRDKADRTRIYKRMGRLIGKDLLGDAPEPMAMFIAPDQLAILTADSLRYIQQYGDTEDAYLPMKETDYNYIETEIQALNELFKKSQANPDDVDLDVEVRKAAFDLAKTISTRFNRELDVERIMQRAEDGGLQYALTWQNQIARPHTHPKIAQNLKTLGVEVKPTEEKRAPFESLMSKFEGKSLQEQLTILDKLDKQKIDEAHNKMFVAEESVPDTRKASILNKLLSEHFPACDLQRQMEAFTALPIPQMIDDFRSVRRQSGNDGCCRPVLCHYLRYLHPTLYDLVDHSFCDGGNSACKPEKCTESVTEKWAGDTKIKKTGQWAGKTIAELQKLASALRKKESRTPAEQSRLKQINFAIRSKRDWKGGTKESISESRGVTGRVPGDKYVSNSNANDVLTMVDVKVIAPEEGAYGSAEELENAIEQVLPSGAKVIQDNRPTSSSLAAIVAELTDAKGNPQFWVRYIKRVPDSGVDKLWKTLNGYKYGKGAAEESVPIKPTDLVNDEQYKTPANLEKEITRNLTTALGGENSSLIPVMQNAMKQARAGSEQPIPGAAPYYNVLVKYGGEFLGPMALIDGNNQKGNTPEALDAYGLTTLKGSTVMFPQDSGYALVDSFIKAPNGQEIGISSKAHTGGGAASSLSGVSQQLTDEIRAEFPKGAEIIDTLGTTPAAVGPLKIAKMYGLINDKDIQEVATMSKKTQDPAEIRSPRLRKLLAKTQPDTSKPGYRVFYHLLAGIVETIIPLVNAEPEFKGAMIAALNNNKFLQLMAKGKKVGNDVILDYYTKFPAVYEGAPKLDNKGYYATGQNGRLGFKLKK